MAIVITPSGNLAFFDEESNVLIYIEGWMELNKRLYFLTEK